MQEKILNFLLKQQKAVTFDDIKDYLVIEKIEEIKQLLEILDEMEKEMLVYNTRKNKYTLFNNSHFKMGKLMVNKKGFGFVILADEDDVYVSEKNMNNAIDGDLVVVEKLTKHFKAEGRIIKVVEREKKQIIGEVYFKNNKCYVKADDLRFRFKILIKLTKGFNLVDGSKVVVDLKSVKKGVYDGQIAEVIGHKNDPGIDILTVVYKYNFRDKFSDRTLLELDKIPDQINLVEEGKRKDLRHKTIFTIDGDDTKDIDDAISLEKLKNGNYLLSVHIADVSYYVKEGMSLDEEAYFNATSVYLADRVVPMLPHKLSNGICSLNPEMDRFAISCEMEINQQGEVINYQIFESVIKSYKQMTYKKVNAVLEEEKVADDYQDYVNVLKEMNNLAKILRNHKIRRGYIDFDIDESKIIVDDSGKAIDVQLRERRAGEMLIEDFMIAANETVANAIFHMELPFVYRVHGQPNEEKINSFFGFVKVLGYQVTVPNMKKIRSLDMQVILAELKKQTEHDIFSKLLLRSMQKAIYDRHNIGHFGIASDCYTHFTSPIRRYPDLIVHRLLRKYLFEHKIEKTVITEWEKKLGVITEHSSEKEQDAVECEREVDDMKKAEYMQGHLGEKFSGIINGVMSFGLFVELDNGVEGLIRIENLDDDYYVFNEGGFCLMGERKKKVYRLGDEISVVVLSASKEARTVDFDIDRSD